VKDLLREGWRGLTAHKVRSFLSTLGILFGVAAVIGILSIGEGARREQEQLIDQLGILNFQVRVAELEGEEAEEAKRLSRGLSLLDRDALVAALPDARVVGGMRKMKVKDIVPIPRDDDGVRVIGADPAFLAGTKLVMRAGRPLTQSDEDRQAPVCLLGRQAAQELFRGDNPLGKRVRLGTVWLTVVGLVEDAGAARGSQVEGVELDDRNRDLIMPLMTSLRRFDRGKNDTELSEIQVAMDDAAQVLGHTILTQRILSRLHREQEDFALVVPLKLLEQSRAQQRIFNLVMGLIAGISLLVGGIGIMNIMLASVMERTREIGIRLAVGATPRDIQRLFLSEASLISLLGGIFGIATGFGISALVAAFTGWATAGSPQVVVLAAALSMIEGVVFGYLPARQAAQLPPAIAVRQAG